MVMMTRLALEVVVFDQAAVDVVSPAFFFVKIVLPIANGMSATCVSRSVARFRSERVGKEGSIRGRTRSEGERCSLSWAWKKKVAARFDQFFSRPRPAHNRATFPAFHLLNRDRMQTADP